MSLIRDLSKKASFLLFIALFLASGSLSAFAADKDKEKPEKAPAFPRKAVWLNTQKPLAFKNHVTFVYFWDYTSVNCLREMTLLNEWYDLYHPYGLEMIWVHSPEFDFAGKKENVESALKRLKINHPVLLDNDFKVWDDYKVKSWPSKFLINEEGMIAFSHVGEGGYKEMENHIRRTLLSFNPGVVLPERAVEREPKKFTQQCGLMSSDTYLGYKRATWWGAEIANKKWVPTGETVYFKDRGERVEKGFFAEGLWNNQGDHLEHARETTGLKDYVGLVYMAREVYATLNPIEKSGNSRVYVTRDETPVPPEHRGVDLRVDPDGGTYFLMEEPRLYYLIANEDAGSHEIKLWTHSRGVAIGSFSFANRCMTDFEHR